MKLSDVTGDRAFDVIADLMEPMAVLADDEEVMDLFKKRALPKGMSTTQFGAKWLEKAARFLLKKHKKECIQVMALLEGISEKQYVKELNLAKLLKDLVDLISDSTFTSLFFSQAQTTEDSSGSASENTEDQDE